MIAEELEGLCTKVDELPEIMMPNYVLVKVDLIHTIEKSGILISGDTSYSAKTSQGETITPAEYLPRSGTVVAMCEELVFDTEVNGKESEMESLAWETTIEVNVGDKIFFSYFKALSSAKLMYGGDMYFAIRYDSIYAVYRDNTPIPVNGWILFEDVEKEFKTSLIIPDTVKKVNTAIGRCVGVSKPNTAYLNKNLSDGIEVQVGDICRFLGRLDEAKLYLESKMNQTYDRKFFMFQRKDISFIERD